MAELQSLKVHEPKNKGRRDYEGPQKKGGDLKCSRSIGKTGEGKRGSVGGKLVKHEKRDGFKNLVIQQRTSNLKPNSYGVGVEVEFSGDPKERVTVAKRMGQ